MSISLSQPRWPNQANEIFSPEIMQSLHESLAHFTSSNPLELPSFHESPSLLSSPASPFSFGDYPTPSTCPTTPTPLSPLPVKATDLGSSSSPTYNHNGLEWEYSSAAPITPGYPFHFLASPSPTAKRPHDDALMETPGPRQRVKRQKLSFRAMDQTLDLRRTPPRALGSRYYRPHLFHETPTRARHSERGDAAGRAAARPILQPQSSPLKHEVYSADNSSPYAVRAPPRTRHKLRQTPPQPRDLVFLSSSMPRTPQRRGGYIPLPQDGVHQHHPSNTASLHLHPANLPRLSKPSYTLMNALSPEPALSLGPGIPGDVLGNLMPVGTMSGECATSTSNNTELCANPLKVYISATERLEESRGSGIPGHLLDNLLPVGARTGCSSMKQTQATFDPFGFFCQDKASSRANGTTPWAPFDKEIQTIVKALVENNPPRVAAMLCAQMAIASSFPIPRKAEILKHCIDVDPEELGLAVRDMVVEADYSSQDKVDLLMPFYKSKGVVYVADMLIAMQLPKYVAQD